MYQLTNSFQAYIFDTNISYINTAGLFHSSQHILRHERFHGPAVHLFLLLAVSHPPASNVNQRIPTM